MSFLSNSIAALKSIRTRLGRRPAVRRCEEARVLACRGEPVAYRLKRSAARRTLALQVQSGARVVVNAPLHASVSEVERFMTQHLPWLRERLQRPVAAVWTPGMSLPWQGGELSLDWQVSYPLPAQRDALALRLGGPWATVPTRVLAWYRVEALSLFAARLAFHATRMGVPVPVMRLSNARTRWGSLSAHGRMGLNWRLILLPDDLIDYVICHELAHLRQHNHSPAFWREVEALYPDYRAARVRLKQLGAAAMGF